MIIFDHRDVPVACTTKGLQLLTCMFPLRGCMHSSGSATNELLFIAVPCLVTVTVIQMTIPQRGGM